jgi:hypothetical protein
LNSLAEFHAFKKSVDISLDASTLVSKSKPCCLAASHVANLVPSSALSPISWYFVNIFFNHLIGFLNIYQVTQFFASNIVSQIVLSTLSLNSFLLGVINAHSLRA